MNIIRTVVSGKRNRYRDGEFDLDLTYITPRLIAMAYPSDGVESVYRNSIYDVATFLDRNHKDAYMVFNLSERHYDNSLFGHRVVELGFPDHHSPPVEVAWTLCLTMDAWLSASPDHVAIVHCLAGKGRTGVICACYLLFSGWFFKKPNDTSNLLSPIVPQQPPSISSKSKSNTSTTTTTNSSSSSTSRTVPKPNNTITDKGVNPFDQPEFSNPVPKPNSSSTSSSSSSSSSSTPSSLTISTPSTHPLFPLPPPHDLAAMALLLFRKRRGEGVKYASQERTVRYFARVLHDALVTMHEKLEKEEANKLRIAAGLPALVTDDDNPDDTSSSSSSSSVPFQGTSGGWNGARSITNSTNNILNLTKWVRYDAVIQLRSIRQLPLPSLVSVRISRILINGVPILPGGFVPILTLTTAPYQGAETKVLYSSAWYLTKGQLPTVYYPEDGCILFNMQTEVKGDVLFTLRHVSNNDMNHTKEILRFSIHSTFLASEGVKGMCRLKKKDVDMEHRSKNEHILPNDFFFDIMYMVVEDESGSTEKKTEIKDEVNTSNEESTKASSSRAVSSTTPDSMKKDTYPGYRNHQKGDEEEDEDYETNDNFIDPDHDNNDEDDDDDLPPTPTKNELHANGSSTIPSARRNVPSTASLTSISSLDGISTLDIKDHSSTPLSTRSSNDSPKLSSSSTNFGNSNRRSIGGGSTNSASNTPTSHLDGGRTRTRSSPLIDITDGRFGTAAVSVTSSGTVIPVPDVPVQSASGYDAGILYSGWLTKRGSLVKNWKKRWFILRPVTDENSLKALMNSTNDGEDNDDIDNNEEGAEENEERSNTPVPSSTSSTSSSSSSATPNNTIVAVLYYYKAPTDVTPKGVIPLYNRMLAHARKADPNRTGGRENCIVLENQQRRFYVQAENEKCMNEWLMAFYDVAVRK